MGQLHTRFAIGPPLKGSTAAFCEYQFDIILEAGPPSVHVIFMLVHLNLHCWGNMPPKGRSAPSHALAAIATQLSLARVLRPTRFKSFGIRTLGFAEGGGERVLPHNSKPIIAPLTVRLLIGRDRERPLT